MKIYLGIVYLLLLALLAVLLRSHTPMHEALALTMFGGCLALVPVILSGRKQS